MLGILKWTFKNVFLLLGTHLLVLINIEFGFILEKALLLNIPLVSGVKAQHTITKSDAPSNLSNDAVWYRDNQIIQNMLIKDSLYTPTHGRKRPGHQRTNYLTYSEPDGGFQQWPNTGCHC